MDCPKHPNKPRKIVNQIIMKKLITLLIMGAMLTGGSAFAQEDRPVRDGEHDRNVRNHIIPRLIRNNDDAKALSEDFNTVRDEFRAAMKDIRTRLAAAETDEAKAEIKTEGKVSMREFRKAQREFRKGLRDILKELREARIADGEGGGS